MKSLAMFFKKPSFALKTLCLLLAVCISLILCSISSYSSAAEPTSQASAVNFTSITGSSMTVNWANGSGTNRIVLMKPDIAVDSNPVDGTSYTANSVFGSGSQIGTGNYVVYNGTDNSVAVVGLTAGTTYYAAVYEFNGSGGTEDYLTTTPATKNVLTPMTPPGNALNFDGINDYVNIPDSSDNNFSSGNKFTIEFWCKVNSSGDMTFVNKGGGFGLEQYKFDNWSTLFRFFVRNGVNSEVNMPRLTAAEGWVHIAGTYDGAANQMRLYKNGTLVSSNDAAISSLASTTNPLAFGIDAPPTLLQPLNGSIDEVSIWNVVRSQSEIQSNMNKTLVGDETDLAAYYNFDHISGTILTDISGRGNNGTLTNMSGTEWTSAAWSYGYPYVSTGAVSSVTATTASVSGTIVDAGTSAVTASGVCYATTANPTTPCTTGGFPASLTGLSSNVTYYARAYATNSAGTSYGIQQSFNTLYAEPTTQASAAYFTSVTGSSMTVNWTNGEGTNQIVLMKPGSAVDSNPVDGTSYTANSVFGSGSQIGTGNYVVYNGTGNSVTVTGLPEGTTYHAAVYEFNGSGGNENYLTTSPAAGSQSTSPSGQYITSIGNGLSWGDCVPNCIYYLVNAMSVFGDSSGNLFVADSSVHKIYKVDTCGNITVIAGTGTSGYSGDGGLAVSAMLNTPYDLFVDSSRNLFIADTFNHRIRKIDAATGIISTIAGTGTVGPSGDGGLATLADLKNPRAVFGDASGNIFIADYNNIRRVDSGTGIITTVAGTERANKLFVDSSDNIFYSSYSGNCIKRVEGGTGIITTVAGTGTAWFSEDGGPAASAMLNSPNGLFVDASGNLFIADSGNYRIRKVNASGNITTIAGTGTGGYSGDNGPAALANLAAAGLFGDTFGNIFISDNGNIRKIFTPDVEPAIQTPSVSFTSVTGTSLTLNWASGSGSNRIVVMKPGIAVDAIPTDGITYTSNAVFGKGTKIGTGNFVVYKGTGNSVTVTGLAEGVTYYAAVYEFNGLNGSENYLITSAPTASQATTPNSQSIITVAGTGTAGYSGDGSNATLAKINYPNNLIADASGNIFIADASNHRIRKVNTSGTISTVAGIGTAGYSGDAGLATSAQLNNPTGVFVDTSGNLFIADTDNHCIRKVDVGTGNISTIAGTGGTAGYSGDGASATAALLNYPSSVCVDTSGNIFIADSSNSSIRKVNLSGNISTYAGTGTSGYSGDGGLATLAKMGTPSGVCVDASGNIFIADSYYHRIRKVNASTGTITLVAGRDSGYSGDGGPAALAYLNTPMGISVDSSGNLFIADYANRRIRKINASGNIATVAGSGAYGNSGDGGYATAASFKYPIGVCADSSGKFYIADYSDHRIRMVYTPEPTMQPSSVSFSAMTGESMTVNWLNTGNGSNRLVLMNTGSAVDSNPVDLSTYTANSIFGIGTQIGNGNYVVYKGTGNSVTVTGLTPSIAYYIAVYEFNGSGGYENYLTGSPATGYSITRMTPPGNALTFDGVNDYVTTAVELNNPQAFTLELWFKTSTTNGGKLIGFGDAQTGTSSHYDRHIYMANNGQIYFGCAPVALTTINTSKSYNDGAWHHVAASLSGAGMKLFIDGVETAGNTSVTTAYNQIGYWKIGYDSLNAWAGVPTSWCFGGQIDEVRIWNIARTQTEIQQNMNKTLTGNESGLETYYNFDHVSGTTFTDITGNGNNGTLVNMAGTEWTAATWNYGYPYISTVSVTGRTITEATVDGSVIDEGVFSPVTARGVCWNTAGTPTLSDNIIPLGSGFGNFSGSISGLTPEQTYHVSAYTTNGRGTSYGNDISFNTLSLEPITQAANVNFSIVSASSMTVSWTKGSGTNRIVLMKSGAAVDSPPVDGTSYTASSVFGSGTQIGTGNYVVYNGTDASVTVTGLPYSATYYAAVYEFNGSAGIENYLTPETAGNILFVNTPPIVGYSADQVIPAADVTQASGSGIITVQFRIKDPYNHACTLNTFEYSVDGGTTWAAPGDASGSLSAGWQNNGGSGYTTAADWTGTIYSFTFNTRHADVFANFNGVDQSDVRVRFKANDSIDNSLFGTADNFRVDDQAPLVGSVIITDNSGFTNNPTPPLTITTSDASAPVYMRLANSEAGLASASWVPYAASYVSPDITSGSSGDGLKTVWVEFKDSFGNIQTVHTSDSTTYDTTPPLIGMLIIMDTAGRTNNPTPDLLLSSAGASWMRFASTEVGLASASWVAFSPSYNGYDISAGGDGNKFIWVEFSDMAGNIQSVHTLARTYYDLTPPNPPILSGTTPTNNTMPTWQWRTGGDGSGYFRYKLDDPNVSVGTTENTDISFTPSSSLTEGVHTLYVQERDIMLNWSSTASLSILIDTTPPAAPVVSAVSPINSLTPQWTWVSGGGGIGVYRCKIDSNTMSSGTTLVIGTSFISNELTPGTHTLYVQEQDNAGNWSAIASRSVLIDTEPPIAPLVSGVSVTKTTTPAWTWRAVRGGIGVFRYKLNDSDLSAEPETTATSFTPSAPMSDGIQVLYVQERDAVGNWSLSGSFVTEIDTIPPGAPIVSGISITNVRTPIWTWTSGGNGIGIYRYKMDNSDLTTGTSTISDTSFTPMINLTEGNHTLYVQEKDNAGNWSASGSFTVQIDITQPAAPVISGPASTNNSMPQWSWISGGGGNGTFRYKRDDNNLDAGAAETTALSYIPSVPLNDGMHVLYVQERDAAGNWSSIGSLPIVVDTVPPANPSIQSPTPTNNSKPTWTWSSGGGGSGKWQYKLDDPNFASGVTDTTQTSFTPALPLIDGTHTLYIREQDAAGNFSAIVGCAIVIDTSLPNPPTVNGTTPTNNPKPEWSWISSGASGTYRYKLDDADFSIGAILTTTTSFIPSVNLSSGSHVLYVQERNAAGNWSSSGMFTIEIDTTLPNPPLVVGTSPTNDTTPTWTWTTGGGNGTYRYKLDSSDLTSGATLTTATWFTPVGALSSGVHVLNVQEGDAAGNWSAPGCFQIEIDSLAPNAPSVTGVTPTNNTYPTWSWTSGSGGNGVFRYKLDGSNMDVGAVETTGTSFTPISPISEGIHLLYVQERDPAGNWSSPGYCQIVVDTTPPGIPVLQGSTPTNVNTPTWTWTSGGGGNGMFQYKLDNSDMTTGAVSTLISSYTPPASLTDGSHTLFVQERDAASNWSGIGSYTIVVDTVLPNAPTVFGTTPTNDTTPTWTWTSAGGNGKFRYKLDNSDLSTGATETTAASFTPAGALSSGNHALYVQERNAAGAWSASGSFTIEIDTLAPGTPSVNGLSPTNNTKPTWNWSSSGGGNGLFRYKLDGSNMDFGTIETSSTSFIPSTPLTEGTHTLYVQEIDAAGNCSTPGYYQIVVDTTPPGIPVLQGSTPTNVNTPTWTWTSGGGGNGMFQYKLDNSDMTTGAVSTLISSYTPTASLTDGSHTLFIQERDAAGNWSGVGSYTIVVDTVLPNAPAVLGTTPTNDTTPTWTWTSAGGSGKFRYKLDNSDLSTGATETTTISFTPSGALSSGKHALYVQERNDAGAWSASGSFIIEIDIVAPNAPLVTGISPTNNTTPSWTWTSGGGGKGLFRYKIDGSNMDIGAIETSSTSFVPSTPLTEGTHAVYVQEIDTAGNWSSPCYYQIVIDTTPPGVPVIQGSTPTNISSPTWTWTSGGGGSGTYQYKLDNNDMSTGAALTSIASYTPAVSLAEGSHTLYVRESDAAGNWSGLGSYTILIDLTGPNSPTVNTSSQTNDATPTWTWISGGNGSGIFRYKLDDAGTWIETVSTEYTPSGSLPDGSHTLTVQEKDNAGNWSASKSSVIQIDTVSPNPVNWSSMKVQITADTRPIWTWVSDSLKPGIGTYRYKLDDSNLFSGAVETVISSYQPPSALSDGRHYLYVQERDGAGNWSVMSGYALDIDTTAPGAPLVSGTSPTSSALPTWTWESGGGGSGVYRYKLNDGNLNTGAAETSVPRFSSLSDLSEGSYILYVQERDAAGNWSAAGSFEIIVDKTAPNSPLVQGVTPTNQNRPTWTWSSGGGGNGTFRYKIDNKDLASGAAVTTILSCTSPASLTDGSHTLFVQERDTAGNWSASGSYTVVIDTVLPDPPVLSGTTPTNDTTPTWTWTSSGGSGKFRYKLDNSDLSAGAVETTATGFTPATPLSSGSHVLYIQESDNAGNWSASGSFTIEIDIVAPGAPIVTGIFRTNNTKPTWSWTSGGGGKGVFRYKLDGSNMDIGAAETTEVSFTPSTPLTEGIHTVYVQESDTAGNWSSSGFYQIIIDTTPPGVLIIHGATPTNNSAPTWTWTSGGGGSGAYQYKLDDNDMSTGAVSTTIVSYTPVVSLAEGSHTLYVQERDEAGNWSGLGTYIIVIDLTAPNSPTVKGASPTNDTTPSWYWTSGGNGSGAFRYKLDDSGTWIEIVGTEYSPSGSLSDGSHTLIVQEKDLAGNWSGSGSSVIRIDTVSPNPVNWSPMKTLVTTETRPIWTWVSDSLNPGVGTYRYKLDDSNLFNGAIETVIPSYQPPAALPDGRHYLYVQERDEAGNWSVMSGYALDIDTTAPGAPLVFGSSPTNSSSPAWAWESGGGGSGVYRYKLNDGDLNTGSTQTVIRRFTPASDLSEGSYILYVQERDAAGNWSASGTFEIIIDKTLPNPPTVKGITPTNQNRPTWTWISGGSSGSGVFRSRLNNSNMDLSMESRETVFTPDSPLSDGANTLYVQERDLAGNWSAAGSFTVTIDTGAPCSKAVSPKTVNVKTFTISYTFGDGYKGQLCDLKSTLSENVSGTGAAKVELYVRSPQSADFFLYSTDIGAAIDGSFDVTLNAEGTWAFKTIAYDNACNAEMKSGYDSETLYSSQTAGYAILCVGSVAEQEGLESHTKTASSIREHLVRRNFLEHEEKNHWNDTLDHIKFFTPYTVTAVTGKDDYSTNPTDGGAPIGYWDAVKYAITEWAKERLTQIPAPLYLIMLDHGSQDRFYLNGFSYISSSQMATWLDTLEQGLPTGYDFSKNPLVIMMGSCYSGSFIDKIAGSNRIIITSAAADEVSFRGPATPGLYRDGEFFMTALFNELGKGLSLNAAFGKSYDLTKIHTDSGTNEINQVYFDTALQHPQINAGSALSADSLVLGSGKKSEITITLAGRGKEVIPNRETGNPLWAKAEIRIDDVVQPTDPKKIKVWAEVRKPGFTMKSAEKTQVTSLWADLDPAELHWNDSAKLYEADYNDLFQEFGKYTLFFYAMDDTTGIISQPYQTYVYKTQGDANGDGIINLDDAVLIMKTLAGMNTTSQVYADADVNDDGRVGLPEVAYILQKVNELSLRQFNLVSPENDADIKTNTVVLDWKYPANPYGLELTFKVLIALSSDFSNPVIVKEWLQDSMYLITTNDGLKDNKLYFWKVQAWDQYGTFTESETRQFKTNFTNVSLGTLTGYVRDDSSQLTLGNAVIRFIDASNKTVKQTFITDEDGVYYVQLAPGSYNISATLCGYMPFSRPGVTVQDGKTTRLQLPMTQRPLEDITGDGKMDLQDIVLSLQVLTGIQPATGLNIGIDVNCDDRLGIEEVVYMMQKVGGLR